MGLSSINYILPMTSATSSQGSVSASSQDSGYEVWRMFDGNTTTTRWYSSIANGWIKYDFNSQVRIGGYSLNKSILGNVLPKNWTFEGSNDGTTWTILDTRTNITDWSAGKLNFTNSTSALYSKYRINITASNGGALGVMEMEMFEFTSANKILVLSSGEYKKYSSSTWQTITTSTPTEADYLNGNTLTEVSAIPDTAWQQLSGTVELCYYTDNPTTTEIKFNIETNPFTLADEFAGESSINIIEYTDNPSQTESTITLETDPFTFYDEMGDSFDVLYYTDDPTKTSAELEINANYTPLDEIEDDFEVVTWSNAPVEELSDTLATVAKSDVIEDGSLHGTVVDLTKGLGIKKIK